MKTCGFQNQINQYLDGELSGAKLRSFESHLLECPCCREEVEQYRGLLDELHGLEEREVPPALQDRLHAALSNEIAKGDGRMKRKLNPWALTAAAAALVVVLVGGTILAGGGPGLGLMDKTSQSGVDNYDMARDGGNGFTGMGAPEADKTDEQEGSYNYAPAATAAAVEAPAAPAQQFGDKKGGDLRNAVTASWAGDKAAPEEGAEAKLEKDRKIIYTAYLVMETREYDKSIASLESVLAKYGGYRENSQETGVPDASEAYMGRTAVISIRMPLNKYGDAINELQKMGNVLNKNENTEDVSRQYVDTDAKNKELIKAREAYFKLLDKADSTESIIALQNEITRLTVEIEQATAQLNYWDDKVSYSTITIELRELVTPKTVKPVDPDLNTRMGGALNTTINNMKKGAENFAVQFVGFLPWLAIIVVVAGILAAILIPVARKARRAARLKEAAPKQKEE